MINRRLVLLFCVFSFSFGQQLKQYVSFNFKQQIGCVNAALSQNYTSGYSDKDNYSGKLNCVASDVIQIPSGLLEANMFVELTSDNDTISILVFDENDEIAGRTDITDSESGLQTFHMRVTKMTGYVVLMAQTTLTSNILVKSIYFLLDNPLEHNNIINNNDNINFTISPFDGVSGITLPTVSFPTPSTTTTSTTTEQPTTVSSTTTEEPTTTEDPTTVSSTTTEEPTTTEDPTTVSSTTTEEPTTLSSTTTEEPTTVSSTTAEDPTTVSSTTAEDPTTLSSTTTEDPTTLSSTPTEEPTTASSTTTEESTTTTAFLDTTPTVTDSSLETTTVPSDQSTTAPGTTLVTTTENPEIDENSKLNGLIIAIIVLSSVVAVVGIVVIARIFICSSKAYNFSGNKGII